MDRWTGGQVWPLDTCVWTLTHTHTHPVRTRLSHKYFPQTLPAHFGELSEHLALHPANALGTSLCNSRPSREAVRTLSQRFRMLTDDRTFRNAVQLPQLLYLTSHTVRQTGSGPGSPFRSPACGGGGKHGHPRPPAELWTRRSLRSVRKGGGESESDSEWCHHAGGAAFSQTSAL